jgi:hypothetical protein
MDGNSITVSIGASESIYKINEPVGKSCVQVTKVVHDGSFKSSDDEIYDKWSQAVGSCHDLAVNSDLAGYGLNSGFEYSAVIPVLVVPNNCLWRVCYNNDGTVSGDVEKVDRVSYFIGAELNGSSIPRFQLTLSHIEFLTFDGITKLVDDFTNNDCLNLMPEWYLKKEIQRKFQI